MPREMSRARQGYRKPSTDKPVYSVRIDDENPVHVRLTVFNRGGNSGQLCVNTADAELLIERIEGRS